ncbi:MAG: lasso peptide biosynthesis B2 protein [Alphaproteobacteria bacterium]|nr:lasso peptide biosynthesis B2 protein [Alphaproteobacteria bacterium]
MARTPFRFGAFMPGHERSDLAWCAIDGQLIFLDLVSDRYFRLPDAQNRSAIKDYDPRGQGLQGQPAALPLPLDWQEPVRSSPAIAEGPFHLAEVARALWTQRRAERWLAHRPFSSVLFDLRRTLERRCANGFADADAAARTIRAFEHARLLRSTADRCLPRSIALTLCLAARGMRAHVVIGVKLAPFGAHAWAQTGDHVLGDSAEEVLRYSPILIV